jgi:hypothetical protein
MVHVRLSSVVSTLESGILPGYGSLLLRDKAAHMGKTEGNKV